MDHWAVDGMILKLNRITLNMTLYNNYFVILYYDPIIKNYLFLMNIWFYPEGLPPLLPALFRYCCRFSLILVGKVNMFVS